MTVLAAVRLAFNRAGLSILPVRQDGTKAPDVSSWAAFKTTRPSLDQMRGWDFGSRAGFGVVAGPASGYRECWDFDDADIFEAFLAAADACGLGGVVARIRAGYEDETPGGGRRWLITYPDTVDWKDCTLAKRPKRPEERQHGKDTWKTLIELPTFAIVAPSNGATHPSGRPYVRRSGDFTTIASYTADERDALIALARSFDQMPAPEHGPTKKMTRTSADLKPGDDFKQRTSWPELLPDWTEVYRRGDTIYLRRPGKDIGVSATINALGTDRLHVFTSSSVFEADTSYSKFGAYTMLHHAGDFSKAALVLSQQGYGQDALADSTPSLSAPVPAEPAEPRTLAEVEATFARWIRDEDLIPTRVVLTTYAANRDLDGDPIWMMLVGGSGVGKTERLIPLAVMPDVVLESSITGPAALLSGTGKKERAKDASGGILRKFPGGSGCLLLKDFTSVIDLHRDARAEVLAALREVYDGRWDRSVGADGGRTLTWTGRLGLIAGCTTAIDSAHSVVSIMGTRFVYVRLHGDQDIAGSAFDHVGGESPMRQELRTAVRGLLEHLPGQPYEKAEVRAAVVALASYVARARSPVDRDARNEIRLVLDPEAPTRIVKMLTQLWRAAGLLGLPKPDAWAMVCRVGLDSVPKLRQMVLDRLAVAPVPMTTTDLADAVEHPATTTRRTLEDLTAHRAIARTPGKPGKADRWELADRMREWLDAFSVLSEPIQPEPQAVPVLSEPTQSDSQTSSLSHALIRTKNIKEDKTGKVVSEEDDFPACLAELTEPDLSDPIGAHDEERP